MRFVLVIGRTPCQQSVCVLCGEPIGKSYLREVGKRCPAFSIGLGPEPSDAAKALGRGR